MKIMSFDPGETTGFAVLDTDTGSWMTGVIGLWHTIDSLLDCHKPDVVVFESFKLYPDKAHTQVWSDFPAVKVIGVIEYLCEKKKVPVHSQSASQAKCLSFNTGDQSKLSNHEYDALRHAVLYARRKGADGQFRDRVKFRLSIGDKFTVS